ncbi:MAG: gliding motility lipoprotein GldK [Flavobacteriaceae bacterium]|nr:gliding motility lipoprotein GldK [Flavobacteriaceae bacterium]
MKRTGLFILLVIFITSCSSGNDKGELVGVKSKKTWNAEKPYGMTLIPGGSFTRGKHEEDESASFDAPLNTVTVPPFYMDETEISNSEYKEFVYWVRDSVIRSKLAKLADLMSTGDPSDSNQILADYQFKNADTTGQTPYEKYIYDNYVGLENDNSRSLDWDEDLIWDPAKFPDVYYTEVMDSVYVDLSKSFDGGRLLDVSKLKYRYYSLDLIDAAKNKGSRADYVKEDILTVYPDTTVWVRDFDYSYNDPMHQDYFYHQAYQDYPVVGVNWNQAIAFCNWRTEKKNNYLKRKKHTFNAPGYGLPSEAEWEYAARGGLDYGVYPWGGPYTTNDRGCFLANFKPSRGDYAADGALYTVEVESYEANDYGLYNMAGNVSEWTTTTYENTSYYMSSTLNPNVTNKGNKRRVIRGGSWKDVAYFLEVGSRDFEYADSARSYIGFRMIQHLGVTVK